MKRFISILTAFALLLSLAVVAALPASAAIEGDWIAVGRANQYTRKRIHLGCRI